MARIEAALRLAEYRVDWHRDADVERRAIDNARERVAIQQVIEQLKVNGPALRHPHQSDVQGSHGDGLRELRPRRGRSRWRPIYRRVADRQFVIFAVAPEAEIDSRGYNRQIRVAQERRKKFEGA